jgi:hypothetical protein
MKRRNISKLTAIKTFVYEWKMD